ncbi:single-stranded DNA-binding protein [Clostridium sp. E02]|uniref:single-stranded DNA-binding protein n=1 Tax=Clostridium sp. E02 TaxID=2487134 RepID=UPI000F537F93|nr:single-stranded DNA-binding protein [Clostridium sp. E02]
MDTIITNNTVTLIGEIVSGFTFNHEAFGEEFYTVDLAVKRLSEQVDIIPLIISERLLNMNEVSMGSTVEIMGQFRSFNRCGGDKKRLVLSVFVKEIILMDQKFTDYTKTNFISLNGFLCKPLVYRKTPLGREIADLLLAVNRPYGKSDYIPCIVWGRTARYAMGLSVGSRMEIYGRIQSREYEKKLSETEIVKRLAYEVSVSQLEVCDK